MDDARGEPTISAPRGIADVAEAGEAAGGPEVGPPAAGDTEPEETSWPSGKTDASPGEEPDPASPGTSKTGSARGETPCRTGKTDRVRGAPSDGAGTTGSESATAAGGAVDGTGNTASRPAAPASETGPGTGKTGPAWGVCVEDAGPGAAVSGSVTSPGGLPGDPGEPADASRGVGVGGLIGEAGRSGPAADAGPLADPLRTGPTGVHGDEAIRRDRREASPGGVSAESGQGGIAGSARPVVRGPRLGTGVQSAGLAGVIDKVIGEGSCGDDRWDRKTAGVLGLDADRWAGRRPDADMTLSGPRLTGALSPKGDTGSNRASRSPGSAAAALPVALSSTTAPSGVRAGGAGAGEYVASPSGDTVKWIHVSSTRSSMRAVTGAPAACARVRSRFTMATRILRSLRRCSRPRSVQKSASFGPRTTIFSGIDIP